MLSDDELMALYSPGLFIVHRKWSPQLYLTVERLLTIVNRNFAAHVPDATLALNILPPPAQEEPCT
jgi:hypothetical protein